jgi:hypothetical protein
MVVLHDDDEPHFDDATITLELQQFFDEWHYRILHAGFADENDRIACIELLLDIFEMEGMEVTADEKKEMASMEDENVMIAAMVSKLPMSARKNFEHFVLQLQLVVSSTAQVRHGLAECREAEKEKDVDEEKYKEALLRLSACFSDGETGPGQQVLKETIIEAGKQIHEAMEMHKSWKTVTEDRIKRLTSCQDDAEHARQQLAAVNSQLDAFKGDQSSKSKAVLMGVAAKNDQQLVHTVFSTWMGWLLNHKANKEIHDKFKKEIADAENALLEFRRKQLGISRSMLERGAASGDTAVKAQVLHFWYKYVIEEGHTREMDKALEEAEARLNAAKQSAKDASKSVMTRMSAGNDKTLMHLCMSAWIAAQDELKKDMEIDALRKQAEDQLKAHMNGKSEQAKGVLDRMAGSSDSGVLHNVLKYWVEEVKEVKRQKEMEDIMASHDERFKSLNQRQKGAAKNVAQKANRTEEENIILTFWYAWSTEAAVQRVIRTYGAKLESKKHQLDSVQTMFRSFANQLEQGINSPRSQRKTGRSSKGGPGSEAGSLPPAPQA